MCIEMRQSDEGTGAAIDAVKCRFSWVPDCVSDEGKEFVFRICGVIWRPETMDLRP